MLLLLPLKKQAKCRDSEVLHPRHAACLKGETERITCSIPLTLCVFSDYKVLHITILKKTFS